MEKFPVVFLSDKDEDITKEIQLDPLGFQNIWTYFGLKVIPHITTVSNELRNFYVLLLGYHLVSKYLDNRPDLKYFKSQKKTINAFDGLIITFEQLFVYSVIAIQATPDTGILGINNGRNNFKQKNSDPPVGPFESILTKQLVLGINGRYKMPFVEMGIITDSRRLKPEVSDKIASFYKEYPSIEKSVFDLFDRISKKSENSINFKSFAKQEAISDLTTVNDNFKILIREKMGLDRNTPAKKIYDILKPLDTKVNWREIMTETAGNFTGKDLENIMNIIYLEEFLCRVDIIFDSLFNGKNEANVTKLAEDIKINEAYSDFDKIKNDLTEPLKSRYERLKNVGMNIKTIYYDLIEYHKYICTSREKACWLDHDKIKNKLVIYNTGYQPSEYSGEIFWRRHYYIETLRNLIRGKL